MLFSLIIIPLGPTSGIELGKIGIKAIIFDPAGKETSLVYDGGRVEINCWLIGDHGMTGLQLIYQDVEPDSKFVIIAMSGHNTLQHRISISPTVEKTKYQCTLEDSDVASPPVFIYYVLCNLMSVKPTKICQGDGEFCHMKREGLTVCKRLKESFCFLGYLDDTATAYITRKLVQVLPKFNIVCGVKGKTKNGLCDSLSHSSLQSIRFLTNRNKCSYQFQFHICGKECENKDKLVMMAGWDFVDVAEEFSTYMKLETDTKNNMVFCDIAYTENGSIKSKMATFPAYSGQLNNAVVIAKQLKQLPTPIVTSIICDVIYENGNSLRYQTNLLLFRSDRDLMYKVTGERVDTAGDKAIYNFTVNVTATDGFSVCVRQRKGWCLPNEATNAVVFDTIRTYKLGEENYTMTIYAKLFASFPKRQYVLLHEETVNWRVQAPETDHSTTLAKEPVANGTDYKITGTTMAKGPAVNRTESKITSTTLAPEKNQTVYGVHTVGNDWKIAFVVTLVIAVLAAAVAMATITSYCRSK